MAGWFVVAMVTIDDHVTLPVAIDHVHEGRGGRERRRVMRGMMMMGEGLMILLLLLLLLLLDVGEDVGERRMGRSV